MAPDCRLLTPHGASVVLVADEQALITFAETNKRLISDYASLAALFTVHVTEVSVGHCGKMAPIKRVRCGDKPEVTSYKSVDTAPAT